MIFETKPNMTAKRRIVDRRTRWMGVAGTAMLLSVGIVGCTSAPSPVEVVESTPTAVMPPLTEPSVEITYEFEGKQVVASSPLVTVSCSSDLVTSWSPDKQAASILLHHGSGGEPGQITASVLGDYLVAFRGKGASELSEGPNGTNRATAVGVEGEAIVVKIPDVETPSIGEVDLSDGTHVPATLRATIDCSVG